MERKAPTRLLQVGPQNKTSIAMPNSPTTKPAVDAGQPSTIAKPAAGTAAKPSSGLPATSAAKPAWADRFRVSYPWKEKAFLRIATPIVARVALHQPL